MADEDTEPAYCGFCIAALTPDGTCPACRFVWLETLTEPEARAFQAAYGADSDSDDPRWANAWLAVDRERARARA